MRPASQYNAAGLNKLTDKELAALQVWIATYSRNLAFSSKRRHLATYTPSTITTASNDETFVIDTKVFKAKTYCFNVEVGDTVRFLGTSSPDICTDIQFLDLRTDETCDVWCE